MTSAAIQETLLAFDRNPARSAAVTVGVALP
jgi:hypothetical protein